MKNFLSIENFKDVKGLLIFEVIIGLILLLISANNPDINFWDWRSLLISIFVIALNFFFDEEKYWNLATISSTIPFLYLISWFIFKL
jgi:hypothetical protein